VAVAVNGPAGFTHSLGRYLRSFRRGHVRSTRREEDVGRRRASYATLIRQQQAAARAAERARQAQIRAQQEARARAQREAEAARKARERAAAEEHIRRATNEADSASRTVQARVDAIERLLRDGLRPIGAVDFRHLLVLPKPPERPLLRPTAPEPEPRPEPFIQRAEARAQAALGIERLSVREPEPALETFLESAGVAVPFEQWVQPLTNPEPVPAIDAFLPPKPSFLALHMPGGKSRHAARIADAENRFAAAQQAWQEGETLREADLRAAPARYAELREQATQKHATERNAWQQRETQRQSALRDAERQRADYLASAHAEYDEAKRAWEEREERRGTEIRRLEELHRQRVAAWEAEVARLRGEVEAKQQRFRTGEPALVEQAAQKTLEESPYPPEFVKNFTVACTATRLLAVDYELMGPSIVPDIAGYAYVRSSDQIKPRQRSEAQRRSIYQTYLANVALRSVHELFSALPATAVERVTFNGYVVGTDRALGSTAKLSLISVSVNRHAFSQLSLAQVDPMQCVTALRGRLSRNPLLLTPIDPISNQTGQMSAPDGAIAAPASPDLIDRRYRIVERLGRGAFGTVYRVSDLELRRDVALKMLHPHLAEEAEDRRRFVHEVRSLALVKHPYVVTIYDVNERAMPPYFTMEFIAGKSLAKVLAEGRGLPLQPLLDITRKLCEAVDCIHRANLIHRDIKADNILLTPAGEPRLMDFGIALAEGQTRLTGTGYGLGTPESAAPEQIGGGALTAAVDIYALGVLVFHMATGRRPFEGDLSHVLYAQIHDTPPDLADLRPEAGASLAAAVRAALAKRPEDRPDTAGAFWQIIAGRRP